MVFEGRVQSIAFGGDSSELWVSTTKHVTRVDWKDNRILAQFPIKHYLGLQGIVYDSNLKSVLFAAGDPLKLHSAGPDGEQTLSGRLGLHVAGMPALARTAGIVLLPMTAENRVLAVEAESGNILRTVNTEIAPFGVVVNDDASVAWISNWGGRVPKDKELSARTGRRPNADRVLIDAEGIAASGTALRLDLKNGTARSVPVGLHPTAMVWDQPHARLYVANSNRDSVSVIDTDQSLAVATFDLQPFSQKVSGIAPSALALSPDGKTLYAAAAGINAVLVIRTDNGRIRGTIPTGWVPTSLAVSGDGERMAVGCLLGSGSGWKDSPEKRFVHSYRGSVQVIAAPDEPQLASYTTAVAENNRMALTAPGPAAPRRDVEAAAIPARSGEPSLIEHVVYIIKENRTYDQVLGDVERGNGDPSMVMYGSEVTPNHHRLAEQYVVLDNFYATGGNSADGHQWVTQANETLYCLWPGYEGRSYPFDGSDALAYSSSGFIWDAALARNKTVRVFGEYVPAIRQRDLDRTSLLEAWKGGDDFSGKWSVGSEIPKLDALLVRDFPSYSLAIPDVARAQIFLRELDGWKKAGLMPELVIALLPSDHTLGTSPQRSSPRAMLADNDLALGKIVEGLTHSPFWKKMAIFVVEDDAQGGVDHVDGHRTVALAISPYVRRQSVDSTFYSHQSMLKTIELILGLPSLSLFDLIANDMRASFTNAPDETPYTAVEPPQSLFERNPKATALSGAQRKAALASERMRWEVPDAVPSDRLNRILWHDVRGWNTAYPSSRDAVFTPLSLEVDDDDR